MSKDHMDKVYAEMTKIAKQFPPVITAKEPKLEDFRHLHGKDAEEELFGLSKAQAVYDSLVTIYQDKRVMPSRFVILKNREPQTKAVDNYIVPLWELKMPEQIEVERERVEVEPRDDIKLNVEYVGAYWRFLVPRNTRKSTYLLCVPCYFMEGKLTRINQTLAKISIKNDQRWEWTCKAKKDFTFATFNDGKTTQGVKATLEEAIAKVIEAVPEQYRQNIPTDFTQAVGYKEYQERQPFKI